MHYKSLKEYGENLSLALNTISENLVLELKDEIRKRIGSEKDIYLVGNGGSSANAHHIVGDYSKTFCMIGESININCLADNSCYITAVSNDLDYSEIYEILITTRVKKKDLLIFLSGSGNSLNLVKAARLATKNGIKTAAILGFTGGALKELVDIPIHVEVNDMEIAEDSQISTFHYIKQLLFKELANENDHMPKYDKRVGEDLIA